MSFEIKDGNCSRCHAHLFSDDDIVYCPVCGAPHHRDCYTALGHCALEELHGTDRQYSREAELEKQQKLKKIAEAKEHQQAEQQLQKCHMCGTEYSKDNRRCPNCAAPNLSQIRGYAEFDFLGGVPADYKLSENVTADEAKNFVAANPHRYIPKFAVLSQKNKLSWNWLAFLFPCGWLLSRKMYKKGIIVGLLSVIISLLSYPFNLSVSNLGIIPAENYTQLAKEIYTHLPDIGIAVIIFALLGFLFDLILRVVCALFGDYFYKGYTISTISKIKAESSDVLYDYRKKGGVNIYLFLLGTMAVNYASVLLTIFL